MNIADIHEVGMMLITGDVSPGSLFTMMLYILKFSLAGMYMVNPTLWDNVHKVHKEHSKGHVEGFDIFFIMMPDIKYLVDNI